MSILSKNFKLSVLMMLSAISASLSAADNYQVVDLGTLGGVKSEAFSINNVGDVVGVASGTDFNDHAFVYRNQQMADLGFLPVNDNSVGYSLSFDINNNGVAVGYSTQSFVDPNGLDYNVNIPVYYDTNSLTINPIPQFDPATPSEARAVSINDNNIVVGSMKYNPPDDVDSNGDPIVAYYDRGFFYDIANGQLTLVKPLDITTTQNMVLRDVNNAGLAVGISTEVIDSLGTAQVVSVDINAPLSLTKIAILGGSFQQPWAINENGMIVGQARVASNANEEAFLYDIQNTQVTELGYLNSNFKFSAAYDINISGQIVGVSQYQNSPNIFHAFIYENGVMKDLSEMIGCDTGWELNEARSINDHGEITGTGILNGEKHAFMLTPIAGVAPVCGSTTTPGSSGGGSLAIYFSLLMSLLMFSRSKVK